MQTIDALFSSKPPVELLVADSCAIATKEPAQEGVTGINRWNIRGKKKLKKRRVGGQGI